MRRGTFENKNSIMIQYQRDDADSMMGTTEIN